MVALSKNHRNTPGLKREMDPAKDAELYKEKITQSILDQVVGANREEVFREVSREYDRLLASAHISTHIPVLVEGGVRAEERRKKSP